MNGFQLPQYTPNANLTGLVNPNAPTFDASGYNQTMFDPNSIDWANMQMPQMATAQPMPAEGFMSQMGDPNGMGGMMMGLGKIGLQAYLGHQQLGIAKKQLAENKLQYRTNFNNQAQVLNTQMEDRQRARVASNSTGYQSVSDYMSKNKVNGI